MKYVNQPVRKTDAMSLVTGKPVYTDDLAPRDCLIVKILRSPHANAWVEDIKTGTAEKVAEGIAEYYKDAATVKVHALNEALPENGLYSNAMAGTDRMELYMTVNAAGDQMMLISLFDNLGKGSSGAALQCMNLMLGLEETKGLE